MIKDCQDCGQPLPEERSRMRRFCDTCIRKHKQEGNRRRAELYKAQKAQAEKPKQIKTIAEIQREAAAAGMSYGQYVATKK